MNQKVGPQTKLFNSPHLRWGEEYVVDILRIREIIKPLPVTPVRRGPKFVEGVISLRGPLFPSLICAVVLA